MQQTVTDVTLVTVTETNNKNTHTSNKNRKPPLLEGAYFGGVLIKLSDRSPAVKRCDNTHTVSLAVPHWYDWVYSQGHDRDTRGLKSTIFNEYL